MGYSNNSLLKYRMFIDFFTFEFLFMTKGKHLCFCSRSGRFSKVPSGKKGKYDSLTDSNEFKDLT